MIVRSRLVGYSLAAALIAAVYLPANCHAKLGMTVAEWEAKFGPPNAQGHYQYEYEGRRSSNFLIVTQVSDGRVIAAKVKRVAGARFLNTFAREIAGILAYEGEYEKTEWELNDDGSILTIRRKEPEIDPVFAKPVLGLNTTEMWNRFGKANEEGTFPLGGYIIKPQGGGNSGKIVWVKAWKPDNSILTDQEIAELCLVLTGKTREEQHVEPGIFDEGKSLIVTTPSKKKKK